MSGGDRPVPDWLRPHWEKKKQETALRVAGAIEKLTSESRPVTFSSIQETVKALYGLPLSSNTISRNTLAHELYQRHRNPPKVTVGRSPSLISLYHESDSERRAGLQAKVARLHREPKNSLIARLIRLEARFSEQANIENRLREEVTQLSLKLLAFERNRQA